MLNLEFMNGIKENELVYRINETSFVLSDNELYVSIDFYACNGIIVTVDFYFNYNGDIDNIVCYNGSYIMFDGIETLTDAQIAFIEKLVNNTL